MLKTLIKDLSHIFFPHICAGCGNDVISHHEVICIRCLNNLSLTNFNTWPGNLAEKHFYGRLPIINASSLCYFTKNSLIRTLMHELKYKSNKDVGYFLGRMMGASLIKGERFMDVEALVPLPLFASKEKKRGYNQAFILCEGMAETMQLPILNDVIKRTSYTDTQTKKSRAERWQNIEGRFELKNPEKIAGKHLVLVDDVLTTGATLEACGQELLKSPGTRLSLSTLACAIN